MQISGASNLLEALDGPADELSPAQTDAQGCGNDSSGPRKAARCTGPGKARRWTVCNTIWSREN